MSEFNKGIDYMGTRNGQDINVEFEFEDRVDFILQQAFWYWTQGIDPLDEDAMTEVFSVTCLTNFGFFTTEPRAYRGVDDEFLFGEDEPGLTVDEYDAVLEAIRSRTFALPDSKEGT